MIRQRNTAGEKAVIGEGGTTDRIWPDKPAQAALEDTGAHWTIKYSEAMPRADGAPQVDVAIPNFR